MSKPEPEPAAAPPLGKAPADRAEADAIRAQEAAQRAEMQRQQDRLQSLVATIYARLVTSAEVMEAYNPEDNSLSREQVAAFFNMCNLLSIEAGWAHAQQSWGLARPGSTQEGQA
jgi:hypothetical protein